MNTKKEIVDRCYYILWEDQSSTVFDKEGEVIPKINEVIDDICRCKVTNLNTQQDIRGWLLDFLYKEKTIYVPRSKKLMEDIDENSENIVLDNVEWLPQDWYVEISGNIISYSGITQNTLSGVTGINWPHKWWNSTVNYVYMFGEDLIKVSDFYDVQYRTPLDCIDFRDRHPCLPKCYAIKPYGNDRKCAIFFNCEWNVVISYSQALPVMEDDEDECGFPKDYGIKIIPYIAIWELLIDTSEWDKGQQILQIWYNALENMYQFYSTPAKQFRKKIGTRPMKMF